MFFPTRVLLGLMLVALGCNQPASRQPPAQKPARPTAAANPAANPAGAAAPKEQPFVAAPPLSVKDDAPEPPPEPKRSTLEDLVKQGEQERFNLPKIEEGKVAAAGIRRLEGKHIHLYTDLPAGDAVDELPRVFDAAVPLWCEYFGIDPAKLAAWKIVGCVIKDKERFLGAGLYDESLPDFPHGYSSGSQLWLYDQPSDYYRRHLLLHEGTHCFMDRWLGGGGPPWYMEGMAELLGTHQWQAGKLQLAHLPRSKEEVPYWGRVKIIKDDFAANRGMPLTEIMKYDSRAHLRVEPYGWCWGAAAFLDQHPLTQAAFRDLKTQTGDRSIEFSNRFRQRLKLQWREIDEDWQLFIIHCDYGYDFARAATVRQPAVDLPASGASASIAADRFWQSTGFKLRAGQTYQLTASGRFQVANQPRPWPCEANGVTIRYESGRPLGMLLAAINDEETPPGPLTPLATPQPIGASGTITPETTGTLYLRINESPSGLADNAGTLSVQIEPRQ